MPTSNQFAYKAPSDTRAYGGWMNEMQQAEAAKNAGPGYPGGYLTGEQGNQYGIDRNSAAEMEENLRDPTRTGTHFIEEFAGS